MGCNLPINRVYWGYNLLTILLLTSWDIQVGRLTQKERKPSSPQHPFSGVNVVSGRVGWHFAIEQRSCHPGWLGYIGIYRGWNTTQLFDGKLILYVQPLEIYFHPVWHDALFGPLEPASWLRLVPGVTAWCPVCHCFLAMHNQQKPTKPPQIHANIHVMNT